MGPRLMSRGYSYSRKAGNGAAFGGVWRARRPVTLPRTRQNSCFVSRCGSLQGVRAYPAPPCTIVALATGAANSIVKELSHVVQYPPSHRIMQKAETQIPREVSAFSWGLNSPSSVGVGKTLSPSFSLLVCRDWSITHS